MANPICRVCDAELNDDNWYSSYRKRNNCICKECGNKQLQTWRKNNPEKRRLQSERGRRKRGERSYKENRKCASFLGVAVAEQVLSHVFKNVVRMPYGNAGYDLICNRGYKVDVKSSCSRKNGRWVFSINYNIIADYFLCLAFDNRDDLNPLYAWLIPGNNISHLSGTMISETTLDKWDEYKLDIEKVLACCNVMRADR